MTNIYQLEQRVARLNQEKYRIEEDLKHAINQLGIAKVKLANSKQEQKK